MKYNINTPKRSLNNKPNAEPSNIETRVTIPRKRSYTDHQIKEVCKQLHQNYMHSKMPISEEKKMKKLQQPRKQKLTPHLHLSPVIAPNTKRQIQKWSRNTILITFDSMMLGINEKRFSKKYLVKVHPFPRASVDDMHHYLKPLLQKYPDAIMLHVGTYNCVSESFLVVLDKIFNLKAFIQGSLPQNR